MEECDEELDKDDTSVIMKLEDIFHEGSLHMAGPWVLLEVRSWSRPHQVLVESRRVVGKRR